MNMPILFHSDLDIKSVEKTYTKTLGQLSRGDFDSADVKKMPTSGFYRARLDIRDRLLFKIINFEGQKHILLLEVIKDHNYKASRFLRGGLIPDEASLQSLTDPAKAEPDQEIQLKYLNQGTRKLHLLNKYLSFDNFQESVLKLPAPLIIIGAAGSGKTALVLEKLKNLPGSVAYISQSKFLVENASTLYYGNGYNNDKQEVEFLSLEDYLGSWEKLRGKEVTFRQFEPWYNRHIQAIKINEPYRVFEEFKGVITGSATDSPYLSQTEYLALGVKQSVFGIEDRRKLYPLFIKYTQWLKESGLYDSNMVCFHHLAKIQPTYNYIMVDEVQDLTNMQLNCILKSLATPGNFILTGDSNQIVHPNLFSWAKVKSYFHQTVDVTKQLQILQTNYRNSAQVVTLSNYLLKIRNARFGSIDKESNYLVNTISQEKGAVLLYPDDEKTKKELNRRTQSSTRFAVIVTDNKYKEAARAYFKTPLVFSVQEAKGLEYENVILMNLVSNNDKQFKEIIQGVSPEDLTGNELHYSRSANKADKEGEIYKFYINSFYVAITRAIKNIYLFEARLDHPILTLMQLRETKSGLQVKEEKSSKDEWLEEARKLEDQGKLEQAEQIRAKYLGYEYLDQQQLEEICQLALDPTKTEQEVKKERKQLFQYASNHQRFDWIEALANLHFPRAIAFMKELRLVRKEFAKNVRTGRTQTALSVINKYGTNFKTDEGQTGLMLALYHGQVDFARAMLKRKASLTAIDENGLLPLDHLLSGYFQYLQQKNPQLATTDTLEQLFQDVKPVGITVDTGDRKLYVAGQSMIFFLMSVMRAVQKKQPTYSVKWVDHQAKEQNQPLPGFSMNDFMEITSAFPGEILPEYRKKRTYINAILSNNEYHRRDKPYCKAVFLRVGKGIYALNPDVHI
jgi:hypothetical protein